MVEKEKAKSRKASSKPGETAPAETEAKSAPTPASKQAESKPVTSIKRQPKPAKADTSGGKYAVVRDGSFQYLVREGNQIYLQRRGLAPASDLEFKEILLYGDEQKVEVGSPLLNNIAVKAKVIGEVKDKKVRTVKFRKREGYRRSIGHRQKYTAVKIEAITAT